MMCLRILYGVILHKKCPEHPLHAGIQQLCDQERLPSIVEKWLTEIKEDGHDAAHPSRALAVSHANCVKSSHGIFASRGAPSPTQLAVSLAARHWILQCRRGARSFIWLPFPDSRRQKAAHPEASEHRFLSQFVPKNSKKRT